MLVKKPSVWEVLVRIERDSTNLERQTRLWILRHFLKQPAATLKKIVKFHVIYENILEVYYFLFAIFFFIFFYRKFPSYYLISGYTMQRKWLFGQMLVKSALTQE